MKKNETLSENHSNALLFRIGEKEICEFMIDSSKLALKLMSGSYVDVKNTYNKLPAGFESMREYVGTVLLPLVSDRDAVLGK